MGSPSAVAQALFGDHRAVATWDLPGRLRALSLRLPVSMGSDVLCSRLTLAPYYTAFSSEETRAWLTEAMAELVRTVPGAQEHVLEGQDHGVAPGAIAAVLLEFLS